MDNREFLEIQAWIGYGFSDRGMVSECGLWLHGGPKR